MSRKLLTNGGSYELDIKDIQLNVAAMTRMVWIVRIEDETGYTVTTARVSGEQDEADEVAKVWLNSLCRHNPGKLLRFVIQQARD